MTEAGPQRLRPPETAPRPVFLAIAGRPEPKASEASIP
ncbi:hypothetical protein RB2654_14165 [Rhodobacterales bacterium HTCC2654]|uniref:Uncharacterized protein n=1 Tax=Maritimibacter alkaliphilus HTCC2654 TaxID=314271 RepID=A3VGN2_9RHOB|nr:hypothetical protein RB2654_14165 [Rhodobacterales bacterium HTCC2654] [Maritimibacter alkaliphilus HTCC2654]